MVTSKMTSHLLKARTEEDFQAAAIRIGHNARRLFEQMMQDLHPSPAPVDRGFIEDDELREAYDNDMRIDLKRGK